MKMRNKGKVHPSPPSSSSSSSSSFSSSPSFSSVFKLLPAVILALASVLSLEDKEVLAYMITRSIKTTTPSSIVEEKSKKNSTKKNNGFIHKPPIFDCDCFDCYTSYWFKWDSSPNRELIHQAIEAFEENLNNGGSSPSKKGRNKKKDKMGRRGAEKIEEFSDGSPEKRECANGSPEKGKFEKGSPENALVEKENEVREAEYAVENESREETLVDVTPLETAAAAAAASTVGNGGCHKGLARKVLPDVLGLLNSRLWSLWSPNV